MSQTRTEVEIVKGLEHGYYVIHLPAVQRRAGVGPGRRGEELGGRRLRVREGQVRVPAEVVRSVTCNQSVMLQTSALIKNEKKISSFIRKFRRDPVYV
jgi:hypothetical protein